MKALSSLAPLVRTNRRLSYVVLVAGLPACSAKPSNVEPASHLATDGQAVVADAIDGPGPVPDGYQRFWTSPIDVAPGDSIVSAQWVGAPLDEDTDVLDVRGWQDPGGHHALLYATTDVEPLGTSRPWANTDQLTSRLVGGTGGEGAQTVHLPADVVFRVRKGNALMIQTHYLNAGSQPLALRTALDVKFAPVDPNKRVASSFGLGSANTDVKEGMTTQDITCPVQSALSFLMFSNHMHEWGTSAFTEEVDPATGATTELKRDDVWDPEWQYNPNFARFPVDAPLAVPGQSSLHTHCEWAKSTAGDLKFPAEMCLFIGIILSDADVVCIDGAWTALTSGDAGTVDGQ